MIKNFSVNVKYYRHTHNLEYEYSCETAVSTSCLWVRKSY